MQRNKTAAMNCAKGFTHTHKHSKFRAAYQTPGADLNNAGYVKFEYFTGAYLDFWRREFLSL